MVPAYRLRASCWSRLPLTGLTDACRLLLIMLDVHDSIYYTPPLLNVVIKTTVRCYGMYLLMRTLLQLPLTSAGFASDTSQHILLDENEINNTRRFNNSALCLFDEIWQKFCQSVCILLQNCYHPYLHRVLKLLFGGSMLYNNRLRCFHYHRPSCRNITAEVSF